MGLYHTVATAYGFEIPDTDPDALTAATAGLAAGYFLLGDRDKTLLVTAYVPFTENTVRRMEPADPAATAVYDEALHTAAVRLGYADHEPPAWLVLHDHS
jgi:hypothetical protein